MHIDALYYKYKGDWQLEILMQNSVTDKTVAACSSNVMHIIS